MNNLPIMPPKGLQNGADAVNPNPVTQLTQEEAALQEYCKYVDNLVKFGLFSEQKGLEIKQNLMKNEARGLKPRVSTLEQMPKSETEDTNGLALFLKDKPNFFDNRENLKKYLKSVGVSTSKDELEKIAQLVDELEMAAVQRFSEDKVHSEMLQEFNEQAKNRLRTLSQSVSGGKAEGAKTFSADEIGAMSSAEFSANERAINEMLKRGQLY